MLFVTRVRVNGQVGRCVGGLDPSACMVSMVESRHLHRRGERERERETDTDKPLPFNVRG
jgi:hypothetical protein